MPKPQKRRPERMRPALKQLTPYEKNKVVSVGNIDRRRWAELMAKPLNKWKEIK